MKGIPTIATAVAKKSTTQNAMRSKFCQANCDADNSAQNSSTRIATAAT